MVQAGPTLLSLTAWRQVSEPWFQKQPPGRNFGEHRYDALAPRAEVLFSFSAFYANSLLVT